MRRAVRRLEVEEDEGYGERSEKLEGEMYFSRAFIAVIWIILVFLEFFG